jgi:hypothetical protein
MEKGRPEPPPSPRRKPLPAPGINQARVEPALRSGCAGLVLVPRCPDRVFAVSREIVGCIVSHAVFMRKLYAELAIVTRAVESQRTHDRECLPVQRGFWTCCIWQRIRSRQSAASIEAPGGLSFAQPDRHDIACLRGDDRRRRSARGP